MTSLSEKGGERSRRNSETGQVLEDPGGAILSRKSYKMRSISVQSDSSVEELMALCVA